MSIFDIFDKIEKERSASGSQGPINWIIAGLGNPGKDYENTRHNAGFMACDALAKLISCNVNKLKFKGLCGEGLIGSERVLLVKPQTFMNLSGQCIAEAAAFYKIPPEHIIIFCDDLSLPLAKGRIRTKGSHGGHNGLKNIASELGTSEFPRIKIGIGSPPHPDFLIIDWVLSKFSDGELKQMQAAAETAANACVTYITHGPEKAMQDFNGNKQ